VKACAALAVYDFLRARLSAMHASPRPAIAVSGGADSLALALLTRHWCGQAGDPLALIVDHGLRPASGAEACVTAERLHAIGIPSRILKLSGLTAGAGLAARARDARYRALIEATAQSGRVDLLLGHHRADQAETLLMRRQAQSGDAGLACMASIRETPLVRLLRPLLGTPPGVLRAMLSEAGIGWIEDPSNQDQATLRARLRRDLDNPEGAGPQIGALADQAARYGQARAAKDGQIAAELAARAAIFPEGFALLTPGQISAPALGALIRALSGARYGPFGPGLARLAAEPRPAVLGGIRLFPAGRLGPGLLLVREQAAIAPPIPAMDGAVWDGRFRLQLLEKDGGSGGDGTSPLAFLSLTIGALGPDAATLRDRSPLPAAVLQTLPALRLNGVLVEVPHIGYRPPCAVACAVPRVAIRFAPANPASGAPFGV
jgi:tRNA(Ile)-lysidine synthase